MISMEMLQKAMIADRADKLKRQAETEPKPEIKPEPKPRHLFDKLLTADDFPLFLSLIAALERDFNLNRSSDCLRSLLIGANTVKLIGALERGHYADAERINRMLCSHLDALPTVQADDAGGEPKHTQAWASSMLRDLRQREQQAAV